MTVAAITDLREALAGLLSPTDDSQPPVIPYISDSAAPPVYVVGWSDPWLETESGRTGQCTYIARLRVYAITSRLEPASGTPELEQMVSGVLRRLAADTYPWRVSVGNPLNVAVSNVEYFGCVMTVSAPAIPNPEDA